MNKWKEEIELIDNLGLLYPDLQRGYLGCFSTCSNVYDKVFWIYLLCVYHLDQRLPQLENLLKSTNICWWNYYKEHFDIND